MDSIPNWVGCDKCLIIHIEIMAPQKKIIGPCSPVVATPGSMDHNIAGAASASHSLVV
jgi:hypothetical protein